MLRSLTCTLDTGRLVNVKFKSKVTRLTGDKDTCNTILSAIERCVAEDKTDYYDVLDEMLGVKYIPMSAYFLQSDIASIKCKDNTIQTGYATSYCLGALRYICNDTMRIILSPAYSDDAVALGDSLLSYSDALSVPQWHKLTALVNKLAGKQIMQFSQNNLSVSLDLDSLDKRLEIAYLILAEAMYKIPGINKILLLSDIPFFSDSDMKLLVDSICAISEVDNIVYIHDYSDVSLSPNEDVINL